MGVAGRVLDLTKDQTNKYHPTPPPSLHRRAHTRRRAQTALHRTLCQKRSCWFWIIFLIHLKSGAASPPAAVDCGVGWRWGGAVSTSADARVEPALLLHLAVLPLATQAAARADSAAT